MNIPDQWLHGLTVTHLEHLLVNMVHWVGRWHGVMYHNSDSFSYQLGLMAEIRPCEGLLPSASMTSIMILRPAFSKPLLGAVLKLTMIFSGGSQGP
jgi:hypothetical protein